MNTFVDIPNYEGLYKINKKGEIKTLKRQGTNERILKQKTDKYGYKRVILYKNGKPKTWLVHRLVALTFIPNSENKPTINHKDGNPSNNCIDNLEWVTQKEQMKHAIEKLGFNPRNKTIIVTEKMRKQSAINCRKTGLKNRKITKEKFLYIKNNISIPDKILAKKLCVSDRTIRRYKYMIKNNLQSYSGITLPKDFIIDKD